jgi:hypothetical protein
MAFRAVSRAIGAILAGAPAVEVLRDAHREWYREFMKPRVSAGLLPASALAGYREESMYLPGSRFVPPGPQLMRVALPVVFDLLESEPEPFIRAVLARWLIGYLNPYREGNERMSQFLMNALLAAGGWQWRTIEGTQQARYLDALERANLSYDLAPMAQLVKEGLHAAIRSEALGVPLSAPVDFALPEHAAEPEAAIAIEPEPESEAAAARATVIEPEPAQVSRNSSDPLPLQADPVAPTGTLVESAPQTAASRAYDESPPRDPTESQVVTPTEEAAAEPIPTTGKAKRAKRKAAYAPQPTQMGLFGE